ncbi:hypothetical protein HZY86_04880 [Aerococcaceae bacterium DSM 111020]|nr:hypothetical protein [Aerococcaceae bacterium DSM 111020]
MKSIWLDRILIVIIWLVYLACHAGLLFNYSGDLAIFNPQMPAFIALENISWLMINGLLVALTCIIIREAMVTKGQSDLYRLYIRPFMIQCLLFTLIWIIAWFNRLDLIYFLVSAFLMTTLLNMIRLISGKRQLRKQTWLKLPIGIAFGSSTVLLFISLALFTNVTTASLTEFWFTLLLIIVLIATGVYSYVKYGNEMIMIPIIVYLFGIITRWWGQEFEIVTIAILGFVIALGLYLYIFYLQKKENSNE